MEILLAIVIAAAIVLAFSLGVYVGVKGIKQAVPPLRSKQEKEGIPIEKQLDNLMNYRGKLSE